MKCFMIIWDWTSVHDPDIHFEIYNGRFRNEDAARAWARQEAIRQEKRNPGSTWGLYDLHETDESKCK